MPKQLSIRDVPDNLREWIAEGAHQQRITQKDFLISVLRGAQKGNGTLSLFDQPPQPKVDPEAVPFKFIDLFAGVGGLRIGMESVGGRCVFSSEWDPHCQK
ncbi:MAG: DNA cytosine methyltransferase, partial [Gaiellaceae bacterium]